MKLFFSKEMLGIRVERSVLWMGVLSWGWNLVMVGFFCRIVLFYRGEFVNF